MARQKSPETRIVTIEPRGSSFRVKFVIDGNPDARSFATLELAQAFARRFRHERAIEAGPTVEAVMNGYLEHRERRGKGNHRYVERSIKTWLDLTDPIVGVSAGDIERAFENALRRTGPTGKPLSHATVLSELSVVRVFLDYAVTKGHLRANPCQIEAGLKRPRRKFQLMEHDRLAFQEVIFADATAGNLKALGALLGMFTGADSGEVNKIEARHVDRADIGRILIPGTKTENRYRSGRCETPRVNELLQARAEALPATAKIVPYCPRTLLNYVKDAAERAGVPEWRRLSFKSLRGMYASNEVERGTPEQKIKSRMGHSSFTTTKNHYATPESQALADARRRAQFAGIETGTNDPHAYQVPEILELF